MTTDLTATGWLPGLVDLLVRCPELADIGYAPVAREMSA